MKHCRHRRSEIDPKAKICPHCRKGQRVILPVAAVSLFVLTAFVTGMLVGGWHLMPRPVTGRPTGVVTQPRQTWRITTAQFRQVSSGVALEQVQARLGAPTVTWWEEKTVLVALWANPDNSNLVLQFEPDDSGRLVMSAKSQVALPDALPAK